MKEPEKYDTSSSEPDCFKKLSEFFPGVIYSLEVYPDGTYRIPFVSAQAEDILGFSPEKLVHDTSHVVERFHPDDTAMLQDPFIESAKCLSTLNWECRYRHPSKGLVWLEGRSMPFHESSGGTIWHGIIIDITDRKQTEQALKESEKQYKDLINGMIEEVWVADLRGNLLEVNNHALEVLGYTKEELSQMGGVIGVDCSLDSDAIKGLAVAMPADTIQKFETIHRRKDGSTFPVEVFSSLVNFQGKDAILAIARDITDRKRAEEEIKRQLVKSETILRAAHHRIKNNIASIEAFLSLQIESTSNPEALHALRDALGRVNCMQLLYDTVLLTGNYDFISVKSYFSGIIESIITLFSDPSNITFTVNIDDVHIDQKRLFPLGVIVEELITNSLKYAFPDGRQGGIWVTLEKNGSSAILTIQDNGKGLPDGFDLQTSKGFGITIVKMLCEQIDADCTMETLKGTKCTLKFEV